MNYFLRIFNMKATIEDLKKEQQIIKEDIVSRMNSLEKKILDSTGSSNETTVKIKY